MDLQPGFYWYKGEGTDERPDWYVIEITESGPVYVPGIEYPYKLDDFQNGTLIRIEPPTGDE